VKLREEGQTALEGRKCKLISNLYLSCQYVQSIYITIFFAVNG